MGCNQLVIIRTDANHHIATGHLVRCLSIANACQSLGMKVCLLVSDEESDTFVKNMLNNQQITFTDTRLLPDADYQHLEKELPILLCTLKEIMMREGCSSHNTVFLLDSYFITPKYLKTLKGQVKTAYIDDLQLFDYPVDLVINYDIIPTDRQSAYETAYQQSSKALLGPAYTPLRQQFQNIDYNVRNQANDILVTTGGSDPYHLCTEIVQRFSLMKKSIEHSKRNAIPCTLHIILGKYNKDREALFALRKELPFLQLHENITDMASLMSRCDLAISASGTTLYELCAVGVPTVSFVMADNQLTSAQAFAEAGAIPFAGDVRTEKEQVIDNILLFMTEMSHSFDKRKSAHDAMSRLVDGKGAVRIAETMQNL